MNAPEPLGYSLLLDDGDLVVRGTGLAEVHGLANLVQALTLRLLTPFGTDRCDHRYGLSVGAAFEHPGGTSTLKDLLRLEIVRSLAADPRVQEVVDVTFVEANPAEPGAPRPRVLSVCALVESIDGRTTALTADVEV